MVAGPNFRPTTTATFSCPDSAGATIRLNCDVETRRPTRLARSISSLRRRNSSRSDPHLTIAVPCLPFRCRVPADLGSPDTTWPIADGRTPTRGVPMSHPRCLWPPVARAFRPGAGSTRTVVRTHALRNGCWTSLHAQPRPTFGSASSQNLAATLGAHAFAEPVLTLPLQIRRLLIRKRHRVLLLRSTEWAIIGSTWYAVNAMPIRQ